MRIVLAPNALKGSLGAREAAEAMAFGVHAVIPEAQVIKVPVADGGDGLVEILREELNAELMERAVAGPLGETVQAPFLYVGTDQLAIIEMATASGLVLIPSDKQNPMETTTAGTGELIRAALDLGATRIVVGLGGSATTDGGIGVATALGARFLDRADAPLPPIGASLSSICRVDMSGLDPRVNGVRFEAMCDVSNPLTGPQGAAQVYGPQKGATPRQVEALDQGLANLANVIRRDLGVDVAQVPGAGAAGGLGAGLMAFLGARLRRGIDVVLDLVDLRHKLEGAALVLTAEGQIDHQTAHGKAPAGVAERAMALGIPCIAVAGALGERVTQLHRVGIDAVFSLCPGPMALEEAMTMAKALLTNTTEQVVRAYLAGLRARDSLCR